MDGAQFHINVKFEFHVSKKGHTLVTTTTGFAAHCPRPDCDGGQKEYGGNSAEKGFLCMPRIMPRKWQMYIYNLLFYILKMPSFLLKPVSS